jgi:hypothetical protein
MTEITELIKKYEQHASVTELAQRFGIHRLTVTSLLKRHGVQLRRTGLEPSEVQTAANLYTQGWSLTRLGMRFGVDSTTVWRVLRGAAVAMRPPNQHL